jgi:hypothetical protein
MFVSGGGYRSAILFLCKKGEMQKISEFQRSSLPPDLSPELTSLCYIAGKTKPDSLLIGGDENGTIWGWSLDAPSLPFREITKAHERNVYAAISLPDRRFVTGGNDSKIKIWNSENFNCEQVIELSAAPINGNCVLGMTPLLAPSPSSSFGFVVTLYSSHVIVYEGSPNKEIQLTTFKILEAALFSALEVAPGIILVPRTSQNLIFWNIKENSEKSIHYDFGSIYSLQRLSTNQIIIGGKDSMEEGGERRGAGGRGGRRKEEEEGRREAGKSIYQIIFRDNLENEGGERGEERGIPSNKFLFTGIYIVFVNSQILGTSKFGIMGLNQKLWEHYGRWFSIGRSDPGSMFHYLPVEILFHFAGVVTENLFLHKL